MFHYGGTAALGIFRAVGALDATLQNILGAVGV